MFRENLGDLLFIGVTVLAGNWISTKVPPWEALPGLMILLGMIAIACLIRRIMPFYFPIIALISTVALIMTIPQFPGAQFMSKYIDKVSFISLCTPVVAYAGIAITKDLTALKAGGAGWKIIVSTLVALMGTYLGSVLVGELVLRLTGRI